METYVQFLNKHWQLSVAFVVISVLILINELINKRQQGKSLTPEQAVASINNDNAKVFDLREATPFKEGHITGSQRVTEKDFDSAKLQKHQDKPIIIVCNRGIQAASVARKLRGKNFSNPMVLQGGIEAWKQANLPLVKK